MKHSSWIIFRPSIDIINWRLGEIQKIDRKTRKVLTVYQIHRTKAGIDALLYLKRKQAERGLLQIEATYKAEYLNRKYENTHFQILLESREFGQLTRNQTIKIEWNFIELNQINDSIDTRKGGIKHKTEDKRGHDEKMGKRNNAYTIY